MKFDKFIFIVFSILFTQNLTDAQVDTLICKKTDIVKKNDAHNYIVIGSQIESLYKFYFSGIEFSCTINTDSTINTIYVENSNFMTDEGVKLNFSLINVLDIIDTDRTVYISSKLNLIYVKLKSGWVVGFYDKNILSKISYSELHLDQDNILRDKKTNKKTFLTDFKKLKVITIFKKCGALIF
jgi:hypothetical protein